MDNSGTIIVQLQEGMIEAGSEVARKVMQALWLALISMIRQ
jgi:hypothetical protein